jgi:hypothetical protein
MKCKINGKAKTLRSNKKRKTNKKSFKQSDDFQLENIDNIGHNCNILEENTLKRIRKNSEQSDSDYEPKGYRIWNSTRPSI